MSDPSRGFETWWPGRGLHENLKPAFFMVWKAALESVEAAQLAAPVLTECRHCGFRVALNEAPQGAAQ